MNQSLAFVFPGQGSQKIGMLADLAAVSTVIKDTFFEASEALGYDVWQLVQTGNQEDINLTERTQPILLTSSIAIWRLWLERGAAQPALMAGHSLGEWSALVCSGVVSFTDAVRIVRARGAYMQQAVPVGEGAMAAIIGLDDDVIIDACKKAEQGQVASAVNFNAPGQVVIAGSREAVERAIENCKAAGAKRALPLPVSAPFHTSLMRPAADNLSGEIGATDFASPQIPIVHNVHGQTESNPTQIKKLMIEQIYKPVLWVDCVKALAASGAKTLVECGPGKVLCGLAKRIDRDLVALATEDVESFESTLNQFKS